MKYIEVIDVFEKVLNKFKYMILILQDTKKCEL